MGRALGLTVLQEHLSQGPGDTLSVDGQHLQVQMFSSFIPSPAPPPPLRPQVGLRLEPEISLSVGAQA